ncbi:MAG: hypothetical protein ACTSV5_15230 [Promethearchaeota archaeon]
MIESEEINDSIIFRDGFLRHHSKSYCKERKKYLAAYKKCSNKVRMIRLYKKKFKLIFEKFDGKCRKCNLSIIWLSCFHFHYPDPHIKTADWKDVEDKIYSDIVKWALSDKVIPLCNNCHKKEEASLFHKFKDLILTPDLFNKSPEQINQLLIIRTSMILREKPKVQEWIRKRYIIERIFDGKCIGCGAVNIFNNLASLSFHHLDPILKDSEISALLHLSCEMIYEILKKEKVVCLCTNCHSLIHSNIHLHFEELFNDDFFQYISSELYLEQFKEEYVKKYNRTLKNINNFIYKDLEIISPQKLEFSIKNIWKIHFLEAFYLYKKIRSI